MNERKLVEANAFITRRMETTLHTIKEFSEQTSKSGGSREIVVRTITKFLQELVEALALAQVMPEALQITQNDVIYIDANKQARLISLRTATEEGRDIFSPPQHVLDIIDSLPRLLIPLENSAE